jgi:uncharacterized protein
MTTLIEKQQVLLSVLKKSDSLAVAFSGGADSSFLLAAAHQALEENVMAVTAVSPIHSLREKLAAMSFAKRLGIRHILIKTDEMNIPEFIASIPYEETKKYVQRVLWYYREYQRIYPNLK